MISFLRLGLLLIFFALIGENNAVKAQVIAFDDFVSVPEDSSIIISPFGNDIITGVFSIQKNGNFPGNNNVQSINNFTQFLYTPDPSFSGFDTIGYRICTVSYTHLRAHETVLDLVCRLLLEKKKHIKKYTVFCILLIINLQ